MSNRCYTGYLDKIAKATGTSKSTVSRTLNHCGGIDPETRSRVLKEACRQDAAPGRRLRPRKTDIFLILPDTPRYIWGAAFDGVMSGEADLRSSRHIYSPLDGKSGADEKVVVLDYLDRAVEEQPGAILLSPPLGKEITAKLETMAAAFPLFFLNQYIPLKNTFYIGEDPVAAGRMVGEACLRRFGRPVRALCITDRQRWISAGRYRGFADAVKAGGGTIACALTPPVQGRGRLLSARLARMMAEVEAGTFDIVYCTEDFLPQVCLAVKKLRLDVICFGHGNPKENEMFWADGTLGALTEQDYYTLGRTAVELVAAYCEKQLYPAQKFTYLPVALRMNQGNSRIDG